jgi:hypothetical protein
MHAISADPFYEKTVHAHRRKHGVLGVEVEFTSDSAALMRLVDATFATLPSQRARLKDAPLRIELHLASSGQRKIGAVPPLRLASGAGLLCAHYDADTFVVIAPEARRAYIQASPAMLRQPYYLRYEVIEFAALTLAARSQALIPLHGACVGTGGRGIFMIGDSGAGKSTLALACLLGGLDFLSEDSVFATPADTRLMGLANYLHVRPQGALLVSDRAMRARIRKAPRIRRRSGVRKYQFDLRVNGLSLAKAPLDLAATVVLSARRGRDESLLEPLSRHEFVAALRRTQPYALGQPGWNAFERRVASRGGFRLLRGSHPEAGVRAVRALLRRHDAVKPA